MPLSTRHDRESRRSHPHERASKAGTAQVWRIIRKHRRHESEYSFSDHTYEILYSECGEGHVQSIELKADLD